MAENRYQNARVVGRIVKGSRTSTPDPMYVRSLTPEQKVKRDAETKAAYEVWRAEREARKAKRYQAMRSRNIGKIVVTEDPA